MVFNTTFNNISIISEVFSPKGHKQKIKRQKYIYLGQIHCQIFIKIYLRNIDKPFFFLHEANWTLINKSYLSIWSLNPVM
jgi:hypothetical protein